MAGKKGFSDEAWNAVMAVVLILSAVAAVSYWLYGMTS